MIFVLQAALLLLVAGCRTPPLPEPGQDLATPDLAMRDLAVERDFAVERDLAVARDLAAPIDLAGPLVQVRYGWPGSLRGSSAIGDGDLAAWRVEIPAPMRLDALGFVAGEPDGRVRLALYDDAGEHPGALIAETPISDPIVAPGPIELATPPRELAPGVYWIAVRAAPHAIHLYDSGLRSRACYRGVGGGSFDRAWPASFGTGDCRLWGTPAIYLVGRARQGGDLGSAPSPEPGFSDGGTAGSLGWPSPLPSPTPFGDAQPFAMSITVEADTTLDRWGIVAAATGGRFRLGLYRDDGGKPGELVHEAFWPRPLVEGANEVDVFDRRLAAGRYWLAFRAYPLVQLRSGGAERVTLCERKVDIFSIGEAWPFAFGDATCAERAPFNVYLITRP